MFCSIGDTKYLLLSDNEHGFAVYEVEMLSDKVSRLIRIRTMIKSLIKIVKEPTFHLPVYGQEYKTHPSNLFDKKEDAIKKGIKQSIDMLNSKIEHCKWSFAYFGDALKGWEDAKRKFNQELKQKGLI